MGAQLEREPERLIPDEPGEPRPEVAAVPPEPDLPGPFAVGRYARELRDRIAKFPHLRLIGEMCDLRVARASVWFELRDAEGAVPCTMWRNDFERMGIGPEELAGGAEVVVSGGLEYYPGSGQASPGLRFRARHLKLAGEGELLARLAELRRRLHAEGLHERQRELRRPALPRAIGVITGESGAARRDIVAGLRRRGWGGRLVWAFAPVQDRHAAPAIVRHLTDLAAIPEVEVIVVARGGGSLADLWAFCDESLCRTVALLGTPVISAVGHETDHTLIDDIAAVACSTPTHAAEAAVPLDCARARTDLSLAAARLRTGAGQSVRARARHLASLARVPGERTAAERGRLHQKLREVRAATRRRVAERRAAQLGVVPAVLRRKAEATARQARRGAELEKLVMALRAHDPERTLERGYALVSDRSGAPLASAADAARAGSLDLRFADGSVDAEVTGEPRKPEDETG